MSIRQWVFETPGRASQLILVAVIALGAYFYLKSIPAGTATSSPVAVTPPVPAAAASPAKAKKKAPKPSPEEIAIERKMTIALATLNHPGGGVLPEEIPALGIKMAATGPGATEISKGIADKMRWECQNKLEEDRDVRQTRREESKAKALAQEAEQRAAKADQHAGELETQMAELQSQVAERDKKIADTERQLNASRTQQEEASINRDRGLVNALQRQNERLEARLRDYIAQGTQAGQQWISVQDPINPRHFHWTRIR